MTDRLSEFACLLQVLQPEEQSTFTGCVSQKCWLHFLLQLKAF